jgi:hypothetical protein
MFLLYTWYNVLLKDLRTCNFEEDQIKQIMKDLEIYLSFSKKKERKT